MGRFAQHFLPSVFLPGRRSLFAAAYKTDGQWGLLNGQGQEATAPVYDKMDPSLEKGESQRAAISALQPGRT